MKRPRAEELATALREIPPPSFILDFLCLEQEPEHPGKSRLWSAALDELIKRPQETPSLGLVLCHSADEVQVRLTLSDAAHKIGVAMYQTALPDEKLIRQ